MNKIIVFCFVLLSSACLRLDDFLYNNEQLQSYQLDGYTGTKEIPELPASFAIADSLVSIFSLTSKSSDGLAKIYALYIGNPLHISKDTIILYCHGNAGHMDWYWNRAKLLANTGGKNRYGVLMMDYRGYGMSEGKPTEEGLSADVDACMVWLKGRGLTDDRLIIYGYSLGSAPATDIAANDFVLKPTKLILEAPFASTAVMVQDGSKLSLPSSYFTNAKIDNAEEIKKVKQPFLWMHGTKDDFLSIETHGEVVFKNYKGTKKYAVRVNGAVHNNLPAVIGFSDYLQDVLTFITSN